MKGFYSPIDKLAAELPRTKGTGAEFMTELSKRPGYRPQEAQDRDLQALMAMPKMAREEFLAQLKAKPAPKLQESTLAESILKNRGLNVLPDEPTKYDQYTLPGGENYREILMRMPPDEQRAKEFADPASGHWDVPNVLAHVRAKDRVGPNGEKLLHIEEIQSDWHQKGREHGYATPESLKEFRAVELRHKLLKQKLDEAKAQSESAENSLKRKEPLFQQPDVRERYEAARAKANNDIMDLMPQVMKAQAEVQDFGHKMDRMVPNAPFKKNWHELALKKMIHHAAEKGYHGIVITPGEEQAKRYDLSKHIGMVAYHPEQQRFQAFKPNRETVINEAGATPERVAELIGKDAAERLMKAPKAGDHHYLEGEDLRVGGEGMKGFYDKMVPSFLNQFGKKYGAKVGTMPIETKAPSIEKAGTSFYQVPGKQAVVHHFPITPEMREDVTKNGVPLYAEGGAVHMADGGGFGRKAQRINQATSFGDVPMGNQIIKDVGGNWLGGNVEQALKPLRSKVTTENFVNYTPEQVAQMVGSDRIKRNDASNQWVDRNLTNYIKKQMATKEDPVRKLAEQGITHLPQGTPMPRNMSEVFARREAAGFPAAQGTSREAQVWEALADKPIHSITAGEAINRGKGEPWMEKVDPFTTIYSANATNLGRNSAFQDLGFDHIMDVLKEDLAEGRIRPEQLSKISMEQAVRRVHEYNQDKLKKMRETAIKNTEGMPVHKVYDDGHKWIELAMPKGEAALSDLGKKIMEKHRAEGTEPSPGVLEQSIKQGGEEKLREALKYEGDTMGHCVGGYCPDVMEGRSRIFSLRDAKGEPHVTVETEPSPFHPISTNTKGTEFPSEITYGNKFIPISIPEEKKQAIYNLAKKLFEQQGGQPHARLQEAADAIIGKAPDRIVQIKGKGNAKPVAKYIPMVQDFVKSHSWADVGDLQNTGLRKTSDAFNENERNMISQAGIKLPAYATPEEIRHIHDTVWPQIAKKAKGGSIKPVGYTKEKVTVSPSLDQMMYELISVKHSKKVK